MTKQDALNQLNEVINKVENHNTSRYYHQSYDFACNIKVRGWIDKDLLLTLFTPIERELIELELTDRLLSNTFWDILNWEVDYLKNDFLSGCTLPKTENDTPDDKKLRLAIDSIKDISQEGRFGGWLCFNFNWDNLDNVNEYPEEDFYDYWSLNEIKNMTTNIQNRLDAIEYLIDYIENYARDMTTQNITEQVRDSLDYLLDDKASEIYCSHCKQVINN